jgi:prevent-host-death family protein
VVAASDGDDPGDDQQQRKDHAPHEPAGHELPLSVVCEHDAAPMRLLLTASLRRTPARGVTPRRRGPHSPRQRVGKVGRDGSDRYSRSVRVASGELRNDTAGVLRRAAAGEALEITVKGDPIATLGPLRANRSSWIPKTAVLSRLLAGQADPALAADLDRLSGDTEELGPVA